MQINCLELMIKKSPSRKALPAKSRIPGWMLNQDGDSVEVALARQLVKA
jgi:hypothetical protein